GITAQQVMRLLKRLVVGPVRIYLLQQSDLGKLVQRAFEPPVAFHGGMGGAVACYGDHFQRFTRRQVAQGCLNECAGGDIASLLGHRYQTAQPLTKALTGKPTCSWAGPITELNARKTG